LTDELKYSVFHTSQISLFRPRCKCTHAPASYTAFITPQYHVILYDRLWKTTETSFVFVTDCLILLWLSSKHISKCYNNHDRDQ